MTDYEYINDCITNIPDNIKHIYDIDINPYFLEEFHETIYDAIAKIPHFIQSALYSQLNPVNSINTDDIFMTFKIKHNEVDIIGQTNYVRSESVPFHFNLIDDGILCDFIDASSLENKLMLSPKRYLAFDVDFVSDLAGVGHSICVVFDKFKKLAYFVDSNGKLNYFDDSSIDSYGTDQLIHETMKFYCNLLSYEYVKLTDFDIKIKLNYKIDSPHQKSFFSGYCKGWTLFFITLLSSVPDDFEFIDWLKQFNQIDSGIFNKIVEIFQVWFYWTFQLNEKPV